MRKLNYDEVSIDNVASSVFLEAYQKIQVNIDFSRVDDKRKVLSITSCREAEGKTTTIVNLAKTYAIRGMKVIIVDLDLRRSKIHYNFNVDSDNGITDYVTGRLGLEEVIKSVNGVDVITCGTKTEFPITILESVKLKELIAELKEKYDYVLLDVPPVLVVSDAVVVSRLCDGFIGVISCGVTKKKTLKEFCEVFKNNNMELIGFVMTKVKFSKHDSSYYYY